MDPYDDRSKLIWSFLDVVALVNPQLFIMENVKALGTLEKWKPIRDRYLEKTRELGYFCYYFVLNSSEFGVPQKRERVFFVGSKNDYNPEGFVEALNSLKTEPQSLRQLLSNLPVAGSSENPLTCSAKITLAANPVMRKSPYAGMIFNGLGRPLDLEGVSATLPASMGGNKTPIIDQVLLEDSEADDWVVNYHAQLRDKSLSPEFVPAPNRLGRLEHHQLRDIGLSSQKSYYIKGFAELIENSPEFLSALAAMQDTAAIECLVRVRGIGAWSAKMYLIFFLNRMDVLPYEDTAFTQAYKMLYGVTKTCRKEMIENCKAWKPYSSLAARYLYIALDNGFFRDSSFQRRLETEKAPNSPLCESS